MVGSRLCWVLAALAALASACREPSASEPPSPSGAAAARRALPGVTAAPAASRTRVLPARPLAVGEGSPRASALDRIVPPEHPRQRLACTRYRFASLDGGRVAVRRLGDMKVVARFEVPDGRNVVGLVGGSFLVAGQRHVHRISALGRRAKLFPRVPRVGPTTIVPSSQHAERFWLHYEGIRKLPLFDLGADAHEQLSVVSWVDLAGFDQRALLGLGDGSFVATTEAALRLRTASGRFRDLPVPEAARDVWSLVRARRRDQAWVVASRHAYRISLAGGGEVLERIELSPHPVAVAGQGGRLAVLSVEALDDERARLAVEVRVEGEPDVRRLRVDDSRPFASDAGPRVGFAPEIRLCPGRDLVAVRGYGVTVWDHARGRRLLPAER